ncbi:MAG: DinB family protein [Fimbriimonas sp.]
MANPYLLLGLQLAPLTYQRLIALVPKERWDERTDPNRFSLREAIAHVNDWEPILLGRMQTAVSTPGATIRAYDEAARAVEQNYAATDPLEQAAQLIERREITVRYLRNEAEGCWSNLVVHPERGPITLSDQANMILGHDHYHLEHLAQYLV